MLIALHISKFFMWHDSGHTSLGDGDSHMKQSVQRDFLWLFVIWFFVIFCFLTFIFIWWFVYWVLFSTIKDALIANAKFHKIFWHLEVTKPFLCFWFNQVFIFLSLLYFYVCYFISLDLHTIPGCFPCLHGGKVNRRSDPGKFLEILNFFRWAEQFPPGYRDKVFMRQFNNVFNNSTNMTRINR